MKRGGTSARLWPVAAALALTLAGCRDSGLPDRNLPLREAHNREYGYPAYQPTADNPIVAAGGRNWMRSLPVESIPDRMLEPAAGVSAGHQLYALRGSRAPYSRLYERVGEGRWAPWRRVN